MIGTSYMEGDLAIMLRNKITEYLQAQGVAVSSIGDDFLNML